MIKSYYRLKLYISQHAVLLISISVSIILHIFLIVEYTFNLPEQFEDRQTLKAVLISIQPTKSVLPVTATAATFSHPTKQAEPESTSTDSPSEPFTDSASTSVVEDVSEEITTQGILSSTTLNMAPPSIISTSQDTTDNSVIDSTEKNLDMQPENIPYSHVETEFEVKHGLDTPAAGITRITFNIDNNGVYSIYSHTQAKGLASLFFGDLVQKSEGHVINTGLRPDFYSYQFGNDKRKLQSANFNWNDGILELHSYKGDSSVQLQQGTQDLLSFMYQFMFTPPLNNMKILITNGKKMSTYYYSFEGEETINSKLGEIRTIHLLKDSSEDEKTEIWLATDYQYLPVRIRKIDKNGTVIEQLVTKLSTD